MAIDDFGGTVLGKPIQLISADHQIKPDIAASMARQWYDRDQVDLIVDVPVSAVGLAVQNVANERKKLLIAHSTGTADFHGKFCYALRHAMGIRYPRACRRHGAGSHQARRRQLVLSSPPTMRSGTHWNATHRRDRAERRQGARLSARIRSPPPDLSSFILQAQASKAKIIGIASGPPDNVNAIKLGGEFGIFQGGQQMAGLLVLITDVNALGLKAAQGLVLTTSFYWDMDDKTRAWSKRFFAKMNRMPTMWQAGVYSSIMSYLNAVKATGTDDPLKVAAKMREAPINDFFARNGKLREDGLMVHDLVLVQVKKPEEFEISVGLLPILTHIPGDQAFGPPNPACSLVKADAVQSEANHARNDHCRLRRLAEPAIAFDIRKLTADFLDNPYPTYRALRAIRSDSSDAGRIVFPDAL